MNENMADNDNGSIFGAIFGISFIISTCLWMFFTGLWNIPIGSLTIGMIWGIFWINLLIALGITILSIVFFWLLSKTFSKEEEYIP